jgi:hypothetical protein
MNDLHYTIKELKDIDGDLWARIDLAKDQPDLAMAGVMQEFERRASEANMLASEALNWVLTIPGLDEFLTKAKDHTKRTMQ